MNLIQKIFGVVISYFPEQKHIENLIQTAKQVDKLIVVDNGSNKNQLDEIKKIASKSKNIELIELGGNLGIDKATNIALKKYYKNFAYVITLDQDSIMTDGMISRMLECYENSILSGKEKIGEIVPKILNQGHIENTSSTEWEMKEDFTIASGRIIPCKIFDDVGFMCEWTFIDGTEWDFSWRLKKQGYKSVRINSAEIVHSLGERHLHNFFGKQVATSNHSHIRRYYIARNYLYLFFKYFSTTPKYTSLMIYYTLREYIKLILFEPEKGKKLKYTFMGIRDFLLRKKGKLN
jgi:rhamnosyltransferase